MKLFHVLRREAAEEILEDMTFWERIKVRQ
jgi:hypothetical protein